MPPSYQSANAAPQRTPIPAADSPNYDESTPRPPKPVVFTDKKGRECHCEYLVLGAGHFSKTNSPADETHRGFTWSALGKVHQRAYRFQRGDDLGTERDAKSGEPFEVRRSVFGPILGHFGAIVAT